MIAVIDYGMGNVASIVNMLKRLGSTAQLSSDPEEIARADALILPGVGAFDTGMTNLERSGLIPLLRELALERGVPVLGLCLGMQLLTRGSAEGACSGLGWIDATTVRFDFVDSEPQLKIPHMGWNNVRVDADTTLMRNLPEDPRFYFVHSYHIVCDREKDVAGWTRYGYDFAAVVERGRIMGTQFHPEKSHKYGLEVLRNFVTRI